MPRASSPRSSSRSSSPSHSSIRMPSQPAPPSFSSRRPTSQSLQYPHSPHPTMSPIAPSTPVAQARPGLGQIVKESIASGFGTSLGMRLAGAFGLGPQVTVKHENPASPPTAIPPAISTATAPVLSSSTETKNNMSWFQEYQACVKESKKTESECEEALPEPWQQNYIHCLKDGTNESKCKQYHIPYESV